MSTRAWEATDVTRELADQVVVLTGASSGIGRETALQFAGHGTSLALAARDQAALENLATEVERLGGSALVAPTDVSDPDQMQALAEQTIDRYGRIDTWINNAGVALYATVEDADPAELRRVVEVDLLGAMYGAKAALPHLRRTGGTLVNVASALGRRAVPLQAAYCAAKAGILGFSEALRLELRDGDPVQVVDVLPSSINTPLFSHARSRLGVLPRPIPPVYEPQVAAQAIVAAARRPVRQVTVGGAGRALELLQRLSPALTDRLLAGPGRAIDRQRTELPDDGQDNLDAPAPGPWDTTDQWSTTGQFGRRSATTSPYTTLFGLHPGRGRLVLGLAAAALILGARRGGRRQ
jgi:short-subunit dehydrogenase